METAHNIDPGCNLIGVSNIPNGAADTSKPAVIMVNAGFLHRVGPNRMNTTLARMLARAGYVSLRMDLSGLGDSMSRTDAANDSEIVSQDIDKGMSYLGREYGIRQFVLVGLCSGANDTAQMATTDERIVGLVNIDGTGYRTARFYINHVFLHLLRRVADPVRWRRLYDRYMENAKKRSMGEKVEGSILMNTVAYTDWTREQAGRNFERLAQRGVKMHFIYTGGVSGFYNYRDQFSDIFADFDFKGLASSSYFPSTDHLNMLEHHRVEVQQNIVGWMSRSF
jgi:dienelactone hydrolase